MKVLGGKWSKGDIIALLGVIAAILAIPGMPKLFHWDSFDSPPQRQTSTPRTDSTPATSPLKPDQRHDATSTIRPSHTEVKASPPSWERVRTDVRNNYGSLNVVGVSRFGVLQCDNKPDGEHCRQAVQVTLQSADETRRCHIDDAGYIFVKNEWRLEGVFSKGEQCSGTGGEQ